MPLRRKKSRSRKSIQDDERVLAIFPRIALIIRTTRARSGLKQSDIVERLRFRTQGAFSKHEKGQVGMTAPDWLIYSYAMQVPPDLPLHPSFSEPFLVKFLDEAFPEGGITLRELPILDQELPRIVSESETRASRNAPSNFFDRERAAKIERLPGRYSLAAMQLIAIERGGVCISPAYRSHPERMRWRCSKNHEWSATSGSVVAGSWCKICAYREKTPRRPREKLFRPRRTDNPQMSVISYRIGRIMRAVRWHLQLTQAEVCARLSIRSQSFVSHHETGLKAMTAIDWLIYCLTMRLPVDLPLHPGFSEEFLRNFLNDRFPKASTRGPIQDQLPRTIEGNTE